MGRFEKLKILSTKIRLLCTLETKIFCLIVFTDDFMHLTFREHFFKHHRKLEIGFVIFYNLEALFKIFCLSFRGYITR